MAQKFAENNISYCEYRKNATKKPHSQDVYKRQVLAIANRFGYDNGSKFAKAFRDVIGVSPSEYRLKENA